MSAQLVLAATNLVMGPSNFGSSELPEEWTLLSGIVPPEVDRSRSWGGVAWVVHGRADWILQRVGPRLNVELSVRVAPRRMSNERPVPPGRVPGEAQSIEVSGHEARLWRGNGQRGLLPRRSVSWLRAWIPCSHTGREVELEIIGACSPADLDGLTILIERLRCH
jgi:hypothetical protein